MKEGGEHYETIEGEYMPDRAENWKAGYDHLLEYQKEHGNVNVPRNYVCKKDGYRLGNWVMYQRQIQNGKKRKTSLSREQILAMKEIGFQWNGDATSNKKWEEGYNHLLEYKRKNGNIDVQKGYKCEDGYHLGFWLCTQRQRKKGSGTPLTYDQIKKLNDLGIKWENIRSHNWEKGFEHLKEYVERYKNANVKKTYIAKDKYPLGNWVFTQRSMYRRGCLSQEKIEQLESIGMQWTVRRKYKKRRR